MTAAMDKDLLRQHKITHIVHVVDVPWLPMAEKEGFVGYKISVLDHEGEDLRPHLEAACNHIDKALRSGQSVLVHCQQVSTQFKSIPFLSASPRFFIGGHLFLACVFVRVGFWVKPTERKLSRELTHLSQHLLMVAGPGMTNKPLRLHISSYHDSF
jgi:Dual specificity phosphatase, catalytic domain